MELLIHAGALFHMALKMLIQKRVIWKRPAWNNLPGNKHNIWVSVLGSAGTEVVSQTPGRRRMH